MMKLIRFGQLSLAFVLSGTAFGQSNLPACTGSHSAKWSNCFGSYTTPDGDKFSGEFKFGFANGKGTTIFPNGNKYVGEFKNNNYNGQGTYTFANGDKYVGEYKDGNRNGQGTFTEANGSKYVGEFKDGQRNGQGTYTFANGDKYVGEYKDGNRNGQGTFFRAGGRVGLGEWIDDRPHGQFIEFRADKTIERSGIFEGGKLVTSRYIDPNSFTRIAKNSIAPVVNETQRLAVVSGGAAFGLSNLPACPGSDTTKWNNCTGRWLNINGDKYEGEWCDGKPSGFGVQTFASGEKYTGTWKDGKYEGQGTIAAANGTVISQGTWSANQLVRPTNPAVAQISEAQRLENERKAAQLEQERVRLAQERERLDADKLQREKAKQTASIAVQASASQPDAFGEVTITIRTNADTSSLKLNGDELGGKADGVYTAKRVARAGQETKFTVVARDLYGNTDTKVVTVSRPLTEAKESFPELNAINLRPQRARDAVAIVIGIEGYLRVPKAEFAKDDAVAFYDYALRLGIKKDNIKILLDAEADDVSIVKAFKNWLPSRVTKDKTDVYVFFSGHGLPSDDGKLYLLPYGVDKDLLERTAVAQKEVVNLLQAARPKSVTMFIDSCYSGQTRGGEQLLASARPVSIMVSEKAYPDNFTVMSASASRQISSSSPDLKHGIFSYYLMKGLEGDADDNKDGTITIGKLQSYLSEKVPRFAMKMNRTQEPQLVGDSARVLVSK